MKQEMMGGSDISWIMCRPFALHCVQITTPAPHHAIFKGWMLFLLPNQQRQSTEGKQYHHQTSLYLSSLPNVFNHASVTGELIY